MNFGSSKPKKEVDKDSLEDEPIPTYEEWLNDGAEHVFGHWGFAIAKGAIELVKYLWTRERLMIELLLQKDIIQQHEVEEHFGDQAHENCAKEGVKQLTKTLMRASSQGKLKGPSGEAVAPDDVLVILNDILDLNETGWNGRTLEIVAETFGKENLREDYEKEVKLLNVLNERRAQKRKRLADNKRLAEERKQRDREERERRVQIYISQCRVFDRTPPTEEQRQQMLDGEIEIPKVA